MWISQPLVFLELLKSAGSTSAAHARAVSVVGTHIYLVLGGGISRQLHWMQRAVPAGKSQ